MDFKAHIRAIPDFPKPASCSTTFRRCWRIRRPGARLIEQLAEAVRPYRPELLVGIESRGFLVAAPLAYALGSGFAMVRKKGKLPGRTIRYSYDLEYGTDTIEMQEDAIAPGQRVVVLDDLIATGGTMQAAIELVRQRGGTVAAAACIIELAFLEGRGRLDVPLALDDQPTTADERQVLERATTGAEAINLRRDCVASPATTGIRCNGRSAATARIRSSGQSVSTDAVL